MTKAFIFPGQGSQSIGMLAELADEFSVVQQLFSQASDVLNYDLWELIQHGSASDLNATEKTQPAMLAAGVAVWAVWNEAQGEKPALMAGHSLGEYTALVCAGALAFKDAVSLVQDRGRYMQAAVASGEGAMAAILGLDDEAVINVCENVAEKEVVSAVNFNSPGQVVIAGHAVAVQRAIEAAVNAGAKKAILLPVSVPSHCALMKPAAEKLQERLAAIEFSTPQISVVNNVDANIISDADGIKEALVRQLYQPVRWVGCVNKMIELGASNFIECGPGKVLAGLNKRIARRTPVVPVFDSASLKKAMG
ncbi:MAG TPA: [acyl-carrier-protein] S-malonyltransferase [Gammaproteobacteria bacterium]|nr:[acyl-carrier-protein] S-malonyltransferase [Gammaproteobacteria bacterium]